MRCSWFILALPAVMLFACATPTSEEKELKELAFQKDIAPATRSERDAIVRKDLVEQAVFWNKEHQKNPSDLEAATRLAMILRDTGRLSRVMEVTDQSLALYPENRDLILLYASAAAASNKGDRAIDLLERIRAHNPDDRDMLRLLGVCLEQAGRSEQAREIYQTALRYHPNDPVLTGNLGLSYVLSGNPSRGETYLRKAAQSPGSNAQIRQNLALALGLQGKMEEAKQWWRRDLSEQEVQNNVDYVKSLITQPHHWEDLRSNKKKNTTPKNLKP